MSNETFTRQQHQAAVEWANTVRRMASIHGQGVVAAAAIVLATEPPEPDPTTFADLAEEEWAEHWGSAVENRQHGWKGWALGTDSDGAIVVLIEENGLPTLWWWPENTIILPDEPRLHIPGITPEPTPDHPATLITDAAEALADAGLLAPDLPEPVGHLRDTGEAWWRLADAVGIHVGQVWAYSKHGTIDLALPEKLTELTPEEARGVAHALLAAANHAEKETPNE